MVMLAQGWSVSTKPAKSSQWLNYYVDHDSGGGSDGGSNGNAGTRLVSFNEAGKVKSLDFYVDDDDDDSSDGNACTRLVSLNNASKISCW